MSSRARDQCRDERTDRGGECTGVREAGDDQRAAHDSDLAFRGDIVYQGNFSGFTIYDVSNPAMPVELSSVMCATDQGDPSIYGNLLFVSAESGRSRTAAARRASR